MKLPNFYYFAPELRPYLNEDYIRRKEQNLSLAYPSIFENFEEKRQNGENESYVCQLIRNDSIDEFVSYTTANNWTLSTATIKPSFFESNNLLIGNEVSLIEYAAFYGSIQIFNHLKFNGAVMSSSLWIYVIHGKNPDLIHELERCEVGPPRMSYKQCLKVAVKCHHNDIARYIEDNLLGSVEYGDERLLLDVNEVHQNENNSNDVHQNENDDHASDNDENDEDDSEQQDDFTEHEDDNYNEEEEEEEEEEEDDEHYNHRNESIFKEPIFECIMHYFNFAYIPANCNLTYFLFYLIKYDYYELAKLSLQNEDILQSLNNVINTAKDDNYDDNNDYYDDDDEEIYEIQ